MNRSIAWWSIAVLVASCGVDERAVEPARPQAAPASALHPTEILTPVILRGLPITMDDAGRVGVTPCATCHGDVTDVPLPASAANLAGPHAGLIVQHGSLPCGSCHAPTQRDALHLADGRSIPMRDALLLCAQCHGPQKRDYDHGAHGGMRGYWDRTRGPRTRNHCVACHDPHAPKFGSFAPAPGPRDRFTEQHAEERTNHE